MKILRKENKYHHFWRVLFLLFIVYVALFISVENGYYERQNAKNTILTEEKIREFENDVKNNKEVDIKDYLEEEHQDYSSKASKFAVKLSNGIEKIMTKGIGSTISVLKELFS